MPPETDNLRLQELYQADQKDRQTVYESPQDMQGLKHRDAMRLALVREMISQGNVSTANDLYRASVIFLHGTEPKDFLLCHRMAAMAAIGGHRPARWLTAASLDRFLMAVGMPQVYGTQFEHNPDDNKYQLRLPIDDASLLGWEKKFFSVPSVSERLKQLNSRIQNK
ncbi:MAG TPA: hypothetical protein DEB40_08235 [Elusimicrobia bacterium]|nr:hypothetical protein [Elusimicrobiota bacterium]HBT61717.1 hypothetical protein [Elusimicrobiota bacterium]